MKSSISTMIALGVLALWSGCATAPPQVLIDARAAYARASQGPAAQAFPAELRRARECLAQAERSFTKARDAQATRDLAYVAERRAQSVEAAEWWATRSEGAHP